MYIWAISSAVASIQGGYGRVGRPRSFRLRGIGVILVVRRGTAEFPVEPLKRLNLVIPRCPPNLRHQPYPRWGLCGKVPRALIASRAQNPQIAIVDSAPEAMRLMVVHMKAHRPPICINVAYCDSAGLASVPVSLQNAGALGLRNPPGERISSGCGRRPD